MKKTQHFNTPPLRHSSSPITIVSGGQTGADRAALDWALAHGMPCGGWCPKGRKAEDGPIDSKYPLKETPSSSYLQRTEWNVRDSDATVLFSIESALTGGSKKTVEFARGSQEAEPTSLRRRQGGRGEAEGVRPGASREGVECGRPSSEQRTRGGGFCDEDTGASFWREVAKLTKSSSSSSSNAGALE